MARDLIDRVPVRGMVTIQTAAQKEDRLRKVALDIWSAVHECRDLEMHDEATMLRYLAKAIVAEADTLRAAPAEELGAR